MDNGHFEIERKFLIKYPDMSLLRSRAQGTEITQTYLKSPEKGISNRVRKRGSNGVYTYTHTVKTRINDMRKLEVEDEISEEEYTRLLQDADPKRNTIYKERWCLEYEGQMFEIDIFSFWQDRAVMEIELRDESQPVCFPPEIEIIKEVTDDKRYTNSSMAKRLPEETV